MYCGRFHVQTVFLWLKIMSVASDTSCWESVRLEITVTSDTWLNLLPCMLNFWECLPSWYLNHASLMLTSCTIMADSWWNAMRCRHNSLNLFMCSCFASLHIIRLVHLTENFISFTSSKLNVIRFMQSLASIFSLLMMFVTIYSPSFGTVRAPTDKSIIGRAFQSSGGKGYIILEVKDDPTKVYYQ